MVPKYTQRPFTHLEILIMTLYHQFEVYLICLAICLLVLDRRACYIEQVLNVSRS